MLGRYRLNLWITHKHSMSTIGITRQMFQSAGHEASAQLILSLASLPLPAQRREVDSSDYDEIFASLEDLVKKAIHAVSSVDASNFRENWMPAGSQLRSYCS